VLLAKWAERVRRDRKARPVFPADQDWTAQRGSRVYEVAMADLGHPSTGRRETKGLRVFLGRKATPAGWATKESLASAHRRDLPMFRREIQALKDRKEIRAEMALQAYRDDVGK